MINKGKYLELGERLAKSALKSDQKAKMGKLKKTKAILNFFASMSKKAIYSKRKTGKGIMKGLLKAQRDEPYRTGSYLLEIYRPIRFGTKKHENQIATPSARNDKVHFQGKVKVSRY